MAVHIHYDGTERCSGVAIRTTGRKATAYAFACRPDGTVGLSQSRVPFAVRDAVGRHCNVNCRGTRWRRPRGMRGCACAARARRSR
jgi:hypothetical protein